MVAYNAATGAVVWQARYSGGKKDDTGFASVTVSPDGSAVYVTGHTGVEGPTGLRPLIIAYNAATGAVLWPEPAGGNVLAVPADDAAVYVVGEPERCVGDGRCTGQ
jgi:outer membrane protein assembly factor BamB